MEYISFIEGRPTPEMSLYVKNVSINKWNIYIHILACIWNICTFFFDFHWKKIATCSQSIDLANEIIVTATDLEQQQMAIKLYQWLEQMYGMTFWRSLEETL